MNRLHRKIMRWMAVAASLTLLLTTAACSFHEGAKAGSPSPTTSGPARKKSGHFAIFLPSDGITLSQHTPNNKWAAFLPELRQALNANHVEKPDIFVSTDASLTDQSRYLAEYVTSRIKDRKDGGPTTIILAPVAGADSITRQYGDYVSQDLTTLSAQAASISGPVAGDGSTGDQDRSPAAAPSSGGTKSGGKEGSPTPEPSASKEEEPDDGDDADQQRWNEDAVAYKKMVSALKKARQSGMHVVLLSSDVPDVNPDLFVSFADARKIGRIQATELVRKLELDKASRQNPRRVEILLPIQAEDADDSARAGDQTRSARNHGNFPAEAFAGIWEVLGPYFKDGRAVTPSGLLGMGSGPQDWPSISYDPGKDVSATKAELAKRLHGSEGGRTAIDGVIAMNDFIASGVVSELGDLGYTGSSADINPKISISGIVGNFTGRRDLNKKPVPSPKPTAAAQTPPTADGRKEPDRTTVQDGQEKDAGGADRAVGTPGDDRPSWPIVTGYGAYTDNIPQIVDGEQWMTALEDRKGLANDLARACIGLNEKGKTGDIATITRLKTSGRELMTLDRPLVAVSASNLKSAMIDTNYIKPADAGL